MKLNLIDFVNTTVYNNGLKNSLLFEDILKQGGSAVKGVSRIKRQFIISTVNHFIKDYLKPVFGTFALFNGNKSDQRIFLFGSTGKKTDSGDIDIALDLKKCGKDQTIQSLIQKIYTYARKVSFSMQIIINPISHDMIHFAYPQFNENDQPTGQTVQIDLLITPEAQFCKFFCSYPGEDKTRYKSAHRNELLNAIATVITRKILMSDKQTYQILRWTQEDVHTDGVYLETKTLIDDNGKKLKYKDTDEDLIPSYAQIVDRQLITTDPNVCIKRYVGNFKQSDIQSFEQLYDIINNNKNFKFANIKDDILYEAAKRLTQNDKLQFPIELQGIYNK